MSNQTPIQQTKTTCNTITTVSGDIVKSPYTQEEMEELGIVEIDPILEFAYETLNNYGHEHDYLLNDKGVNNYNKVGIKKYYFDLKNYLNQEISNFKQDKLKKKEKNRIKQEQAMAEARRIKDYNRRESAGLLTPEELAEKEARKKAKKDKWLNKK